MRVEIEKILTEQLKLLGEVSKKSDEKQLKNLTDAMIEIVMLIEPESRNQSFYGASTCHPYEIQLPVADLVDLYVGRAAYANQYLPPEVHRKK